MTKYCGAMTSNLHETLSAFLQRADGQEDICFGLYRPSTSDGYFTGVLVDIIDPEPGDRQVHGNASINPSYVERATSLAFERSLGLALLHSHPCGCGWQSLSRDDVLTEEALAAVAYGATGLPLMGLIQAGDLQWSARFWPRIGPRRYERAECERVRVAGRRFSMTYDDRSISPPQATDLQVRTVNAWGDRKHADLARLRVGIVGAGSVGGVIAEGLARMGIADLTLVDFDIIEPHNLDRLTFASTADIGKLKVVVLADYLKAVTTANNFKLCYVPLSLVDEEAQAAILACDVVFSCVDRPLGRHLLNQIAFAHVIPVVDGGSTLR